MQRSEYFFNARARRLRLSYAKLVPSKLFDHRSVYQGDTADDSPSGPR